MSRRIHGSGPAPCEFFMCGEGPGWREDREGAVFAGKTGEELNRFLDSDRLPARNEWFLSNLYREYHGKDYVYTAKDLKRDEQDLVAELRRVKPRVIVPLGRHATRWFLGDVDMDSCAGIPWVLSPSDKLSFLGNETIVFPVVHPAAGLHNPEMSPYVVSGFHELGNFLAGLTKPRLLFDDPHPEPQYEEITSQEQLASRLQDVSSGSRLAIDTEGSPALPWSVQFSCRPGQSCLIRATRRDLLSTFRTYLNHVRPRIIYHSALHDLGMIRALELPIDLPFDDTMVMAYLLQIEPQGLKALCARHCNMQMQSYDELVKEPSDRLALNYAYGLWDVEQLDYEERCQHAFQKEIDKGRRITKTPKLPKTALHKAAERLLRSKNPRTLWSNQIEDIQVSGYGRLGSSLEATLDHVPAKLAVAYGCRDADGTGRLYSDLSDRIDGMGLREVYDLELSTYPLIERMHHVGIKPDLDHFARLSMVLQSELAHLQDDLARKTSDASFNANSGDQVAEYLFDRLGIDPIGRPLKSERFSTNDKILEALEHEHPEHPVITAIRQYRETYKLKNTFVDVVPDLVRGWPYDGRVHVEFRTTRIPTGRLAATMPRGFPRYNMLAQPKRGRHAKDFRRGWVPEPDHLLVEFDLSQIELRVGAHLSQDPYMLAVYRGEIRNPDGSFVDLHAGLAQRIFGVPKHDQTVSQRTSAKEINFGFWMGQTAVGLMLSLRSMGVSIDQDDAQRWLDEANELYAGAQPYKNRMIAEAQQSGYVRCLSGRIRYIGGIRSRDERIRAEAGRFAFSTPVQEGAQWIMKQAEQRLYEDILVRFWRQGRWVEPLIQIHDSLLLECEDDPVLAQELNEQMRANLTTAPSHFSVPIETSGEWGYSWADMKERFGYDFT